MNQMNQIDPIHTDLSRRLFVELGTSLLVDARKKTVSISGKLIGMKVGGYLIIGISGAKPDNIPLAVGEDVQVRYVNQDNIFCFSSQVISVLDQPDTLLFLQYPVLVENCNIRGHKRVDCFLPVDVVSGKQTGPGLVLNVSPRGCLCQVGQEQQWEKTDRIKLVFPCGDADPLGIKGEVRSIRVQADQIHPGHPF